jgi:hypothetical protein
MFGIIILMVQGKQDSHCSEKIAVRDLLRLDGSRLTEEDRRLLIDKTSKEVLSFEQMKSNNVALLTLIISIVVSTATIVLVSPHTNTLIGLIIAIALIVVLILFTLKIGTSLRNAMGRINKQKKQVEIEHTNLMNIHFKYALKGRAILT